MVAANAPAHAAGITCGLGLSDANARTVGLVSEPIDRAADRAALRRLANWMIRHTPLVALDGEDGLVLETTGCDHLHGGETAMLGAISSALTSVGYTHRLGLAGTPIAAAALAHAAIPSPAANTMSTVTRPVQILANGKEADGLSDLPIAALRLAPDTLTLLRRFGLTRIGQLYGIDRKALARRFQSKVHAGQLVSVLDQALGLRPTPLKPLRPAIAHAAQQACPDPLIDRAGIAQGLADLTRTVCSRLTANGLGARRFTLRAFRADGTLTAKSVTATRPVRAPDHILRLFDEHLDTVDPGYGIDLLRLEATRTAPMDTGMGTLSTDLAGKAIDETDLSALADRLVARLGDGRVRVLEPVASHKPEKACRLVPFEGKLPDWQTARPGSTVAPGQGLDAHMGPRPLTLFQRPEPVDVIAEVPDGPPLRFVWRNVPRRIVWADGPERIAPEWWQYLPRAPVPKETQASLPAPRQEGSGQHTRQALLPLGASAPEGASKRWLVPKMDPRADAHHIARARAALDAPHAQTPKKPVSAMTASSALALPNCVGTRPGTDASPPGDDPGVTLPPPRPRARDYYRVEDANGHRYWLFRDGLYHDGRGPAPTWYIHGLGP